MRLSYYSILFIFILFVTSSCISKINIDIRNSNFIVNYENEYMDSVNDFKESFESVLEQKINLYDLKNDNIVIDADEIYNAVNERKLNGIIEFRDNTYIFNINVENYENLEEFFPIIGNEKIKTYLAAYNIDMTQTEYIEMIDFVFGEDAANDLLNSTIDITFTSKSNFISYTGLKMINSNTLVLNLKLIDFLLLKEPIKFSFTN